MMPAFTEPHILRCDPGENGRSFHSQHGDQTLNTQIRKKIEEILPEGSVLINEPMSKHTTFKTGGPADFFVTVDNAELLKKIITLAIESEITYYIVGNGSNILVSDEGFRGIIIRIKSEPELIIEKEPQVDGRFLVRAGAGCSLRKLAGDCTQAGLTGLEFAAGIPGSVGGAVTMNAGAYGGEIGDHIVSVSLMNRIGRQFELPKEKLEFGYRTSIIQSLYYIALEAVFALEQGDKEQGLQTIAELAARRRDKQPLEFPSAGSTFKRPEGYFAGKLIEDAGLKGLRVGDAQVSEKHAGFVINRGRATSEDIHTLILKVQRRVLENSGVYLEPEVKMLGF